MEQLDENTAEGQRRTSGEDCEDSKVAHHNKTGRSYTQQEVAALLDKQASTIKNLKEDNAAMRQEYNELKARHNRIGSLFDVPAFTNLAQNALADTSTDHDTIVQQTINRLHARVDVLEKAMKSNNNTVALQQGFREVAASVRAVRLAQKETDLQVRNIRKHLGDKCDKDEDSHAKCVAAADVQTRQRPNTHPFASEASLFASATSTARFNLTQAGNTNAIGNTSIMHGSGNSNDGTALSPFTGLYEEETPKVRLWYQAINFQMTYRDKGFEESRAEDYATQKAVRRLVRAPTRSM